MASDLSLFGRRLLKNPRQISALSPSSRALALAMTEGLGPQTGRVVEFGPGTGRLTRAILDRGVAPRDVTLFEMDEVFARHLHDSFHGVRVEHRPAQDAPEVVGPAQAGAVISGLPLLSMPPPLRVAIVAAGMTVLKPGAPFVQFTYGARPPLSDAQISALGLRVEEGRLVWANLPPARIFRFRRG